MRATEYLSIFYKIKRSKLHENKGLKLNFASVNKRLPCSNNSAACGDVLVAKRSIILIKVCLNAIE